MGLENPLLSPALFLPFREADSKGFGLAFLRSSVSINRSEFSVRSVAANTLGLGPRDRRCKSCRADQFQIAAVVEYTRHPPSKSLWQFSKNFRLTVPKRQQLSTEACGRWSL